MRLFSAQRRPIEQLTMKRGNPSKDFIGRRFDRLTVVSLAGYDIQNKGKRRRARFECRCDCGKTVTAGYILLKTGVARSCGCRTSELRTTHGDSKTALYTKWRSMHERCTNPSHASYSLYGGRGIKVCERWNRYEAFKSDMGKMPPGTSLDRIDANGDYEPTNCRWATNEQQANNTRANVHITFNGQTKTLSQWARSTGQTFSRLWYRLDHGWPIGEALTRGRSRGMRRDLKKDPAVDEARDS
jgi:hypothetical protein